ncbi:protein SCO1/2 [Desulfuromusa kysingii]|uniref:Protein SCO1/2 n=1 Tax=Desulfuromusa kysingii TaxID=37625 RepID=A0A1H3W5D2_9BACT|nr:SCO family protein [Desulfuromusa kysingii]SDZ82210.1 protein SCO1/2 [Desulfuromusa kysingii]
MLHKVLLLLLFLLVATPVFATDGRVELVERLGEKIPLQLNFVDSTGVNVSLEELVDRPTLIVPVFYDCRNVCNMMLGTLSAVLPEVKMEPGEAYNVITFSFDPLETPAMAAHSKQTFLTAMQAPFPKQAWRFLTGTQENILQLTDAAGYYFKKEGDEFLHPITAFIVTKDGTIVRYLPGQRFSAIDMSMALFEASEGRIGKPIRQALQFCFSYDPEGRRYVFNLMRVSGTVILLTLGSFLLFLILSGRKKKK